MTFNSYMDAIGAVGYIVALLVLAAIPLEPEGLVVKGLKPMIAGFLVVYLYLTGLDALGRTHISAIGDLFEDYVQVLPAVLALGAVYALYSAQQYRDMANAHRALQQSHDLMMDVVDEAPAGILLLDPAGRIAFANETAKSILDLEEDADGAVRGPGWTVRGDGIADPDTLPGLVREQAFQGKELRLDWPNGWFVELRASGKPLSDSKDRLGGIVVMFERAMGGESLDLGNAG